MQLRSWVKERYGGTGDELLDRSTIDDQELKQDKYKLEHKLKRLENEMAEHEGRYQQLLQKGAESSEMKRKTYAQKAELEKKKYAVKKKKYKNYRLKLGTVISVQGMREVMDMDEEDSLNIDDAMDEAEVGEVRENVLDQMAQFNIEMEEMEAIQDALDIEIMDDEGIGAEDSEALEQMERIREAGIDPEEVDIEETVDSDELDSSTGDIDIDDDLDVEDDLDVGEI